MRFDGILKTWNDDRCFGFIEPTRGVQEIFVPIKSFDRLTARLAVGQALSFEVELNPEGKKRAKHVQPVRPARTTTPRRRNAPAQWGTASFFAISAFGLMYLIATVLWRVRIWVAGLYGLASLICCFVYAIDKAAVRGMRSRVPESTLLLLGLVGGWPSAIVAQQVLRHKSNKASFRSAFWVTLMLNALGFLELSYPLFAMVVL